MAQQALGIIKTEGSLGMALLTRNYKQYQVKAGQTVPLTADQSDSDAVHSEITDHLTRFVRDQKISKCRTGFGLQQSELLWNIIEMPPVSQEDVRQILAFELDSHIPVNPDSVCFDALILDSSSSMTSHVALAAADKKKIDSIREITVSADVDLDAVTPATISILNLITISWKPVTDAPFNIFLLAKHSQYEVIIVKDGQFFAVRSAELTNPWFSNGMSDLEKTDGQGFSETDAILNSIKLALLSCNLSSDLKDVQEISCIGSCSQNLIDKMKELLPATVFSSVQIDNLINQNQSYEDIAAISIAAEQLGDFSTINMLPVMYRPVRRDIGRLMIGCAAGFLFAALILVGANSFWSTELALAATNAKIASLETRVNQITEINQRYSDAQDARQFFMSRSGDYPSHLDVLLEVTRLLPAEDTDDTNKVWLESYEIENHQLSIRGDSDSPEGLLTSLEESPYFEGVKFDGTVSGTRFTIKADISKLTEVEEPADGEGTTSTGESEQPAPKSDSPKENEQVSPTPQKDSEENSSETDADDLDEEEMEQTHRGPAFPRTLPDEEDEDEEELKHVEPLSPDEQEALDEETRQEDMEAMKKNLFDFIKERKESGEIEPGPRDHEQQDPDEAAANFLEFLKAAADSGEEAN